MKKDEAEDSDALENVLHHAGGMGLYQKLLFLSMLPIGYFFVFIYFGQMFITATPQQHWCHVPELAHLDLETRRNLSVPRVGDGWAQCAVYVAKWSRVLDAMQPPEPDTPTLPCKHGWDFQLGDIPYHTVVSERGWVCEYAGYAPLAQTIYFVGALVGGILFGWMADRFGRVPVLVGTHLVACVGGLGTIYTTGVWDFIICRFLVGMAFDNCAMMLYILVLEYVAPQYRTLLVSMSTALFFGTGALLLPWIAYFIADWRKFLWVISLPLALCAFAPFIIPESARSNYEIRFIKNPTVVNMWTLRTPRSFLLGRQLVTNGFTNRQFLYIFVLIVKMILTKVDNDDPDYVENYKEEMKKEVEGSDALERVLFHVGEMGRYQKLLFFSMLPFSLFFTFIYFGQMFITATPQQHWCHVPELEHLDLETRRNLSVPRVGEGWAQCAVYAANWSNVLYAMQPPEPGTPTVPCQHGWDFKLGDIPYHTVVSERGWVCEYAGYAPFAQTMYFVGSFTGGMIFGWAADHFGRVPALVGSNLIACVGGLGTIFTKGLWDFVFCRFLVGMAFDNCFMLLYILVLEYVGPKQRTWAANFPLAFFFGGSFLLIPWLAYWIADWRKFLWYTTLPLSSCLLVPYLIPESARWLASRGKVSQAVKVLRRFETINRTKVPQDVMDEFIVSSSQAIERESIIDVFKSAPLRKMMLLLMVIYMACMVIFDGLVRMSEGLGLDFFLAFTLASATQIPSVGLVAVLLDRLGRRNLAMGPIVITGIFTVTAAFVPKGLPQMILAIGSRFAINMACTAAVQWSTELVPTGARASGLSLVHVSGYVANMLSPLIVYSARIWSPFPLLTLGTIALTASSFCFLLPETKGRPMPQTIAEGEKIMRSHTLCGKVEEEHDFNEKEKALIT